MELPDIEPVTKPDAVTEPTAVTKPHGKSKGGRPLIGERAMTAAERMKRSRERQKAQL
jgi:hypothetical protein